MPPFTEKPMPALPPVRYADDPRRCHCGGWLRFNTNVRGTVEQRCPDCGAWSELRRIAAPVFEAEPSGKFNAPPVGCEIVGCDQPRLPKNTRCAGHSQPADVRARNAAKQRAFRERKLAGRAA
jgi:hypothetical protein